MKFSSLYFITFLIIVLEGCQNTGEPNIEKRVVNGQLFLIEKLHDNKGKLVEEITLNIDSVRNGSYRKYFPNGTTECLGFYRNGIKDSIWKYYYNNGEIKEEQSWFDGKTFGEQKSYYYNGKIKSYRFKNISEESTFSSMYDSTGHLIKWDGVPIYCAFNTSNLKVNEVFELYCFFGVPPGMSFTAEIEEKDVKGSQSFFKEKYIETDIVNLYFGRKIPIEEKCVKKGEYLWTIRVNYYCNEIKKSDSVLLNLKVD